LQQKKLQRERNNIKIPVGRTYGDFNYWRNLKAIYIPIIEPMAPKISDEKEKAPAPHKRGIRLPI